MSVATLSTCLHCGTALGSEAFGGFCCRGCERVYGLVCSLGLDRYYALRGGDGAPIGAVDLGSRDHKWIETLAAGLVDATGLTRVAMDVQGVRCAACVWLLSSLFEQQPHGASCVVNSSRGRIELTVEPGFDLYRFVESVESLGYLVGPALKTSSRRLDDLTLRMGLCLALAMNTMTFAVAIYLGLSDGLLYETARDLTFALSLAAVLIGGSFFVRSAWQSLRRGLLHLDLPIAVGIGLALAGSTWSFFTRSGAEYFDTLTIFIALMLVGRWTQERVVARNRAQLLASDGVDGLWSRRVKNGAVELVRCVELEKGDQLLLAPGDLLPTDGMLRSQACLRMDWINGESEPRQLAAGAPAPAGAFNAGVEALRVDCASDFGASPLIELLATPRAKESGQAAVFWDRLARYYVAGVLLAAAGGFVLWLALTGDVARALSVTTAVLVVTCPCAFGIAAPLAHDLVQSALRRAGLFVRTDTLLARAPFVDRVVFDKTGTLTTGVPRLVDASPLATLTNRERTILYNLAANSRHPKSAAIAAALTNVELDDTLTVHEETSAGTQTLADGHLFRLGRVDWAAPTAIEVVGDLVFAEGGRPRCVLSTEEDPRHDAAEEIAKLRADGYQTWILSGDAPERTRALARELGVADTNAIGGQSADQKAEWLSAHSGSTTLFVGDGINDGPAADRALCAGTPAIDRPFMPARSDFYFVTSGLAPIRRLLEASRRLRTVVRTDLAFALAYNAVAVALAYAGWIEPWVAAVLMPLSSIGVLLYTGFALGRRLAVEILILLIFVSLLLAGAAGGFFAWTLRQGSNEHSERLALLPLEDDIRNKTFE